MKKLVSGLIALTLAATLAACSAGPSPSEIATMISPSVLDAAVDFVEIDDLKVVNGYEENGFYHAKVNFNVKTSHSFDEHVAMVKAMDGLNSMAYGVAVTALQQATGDDYQKGDIVTNTGGTYKFTKGSQGWMLAQ